MSVDFLRSIYFKSIIVLGWTIMLLSCKNDLKEVNKLGGALQLP